MLLGAATRGILGPLGSLRERQPICTLTQLATHVRRVGPTRGKAIQKGVFFPEVFEQRQRPGITSMELGQSGRGMLWSNTWTWLLFRSRLRAIRLGGLKHSMLQPANKSMAPADSLLKGVDMISSIMLEVTPVAKELSYQGL